MLKHIGRVILTHTLEEKLNKQSEKHKCIIRDTSVHPNKRVRSRECQRWSELGQRETKLGL